MSSQTSDPVSSLQLERSIIVRAGAGAGKTTALTEQVLAVAKASYQLNKRYPRIVVTTFTKKATQELKERLILLALKKENALLEFVNSPSDLKISTIHGILDQYLRQYGSALMLDPSFTVINSSLASQMARQVIRRILLTHDEREILQVLIDDFSFVRLEKLCRQYYRVKMIHPEIVPHNPESLEVLCQVHINNISREIDELVRSIQSEETNIKWMEYAKQMEFLSKELKTRRWSVDYEFLKNFFEQMPTATRTKNIQISEETNDFKKELSARLRDLFDNESYHPDSFKLFSEKFLLCQKLFDAFTQEFFKLKLQTASVEIDDLEILSLKMAREFGETAKAFSDEWDYWLIDEYQDTSPVQVELIKHLTQSKPQYVVGDPQQSIYLFRGARSEVFQNREIQILQEGGTKTEKIHNYRSQPPLLEFFNDFFTHFQIPFSPMSANWPDEKKTKQTSESPIAKFYISESNVADDDLNEDSENAFHEQKVKEDDESLAIVQHINELLEKGSKLEDVCILARTNKNLSEISKVLTQFGLLNHLHISSGFYQRREIQDALALYKFLVHPHNNLNLLILLRSPWFLVDDQFLVDHLPSAKESYWVFLSTFKKELSGISRLSDCLERVPEIGIGSCFLESLLKCGIFDLSKYQDPSGLAESNLWKLVSLLREQEQKAGFNPLDLVAQIESDARANEDSEGDAVPCVEPDRINLMTIHASKGLQFRHVIVARMHKRPKAPTEPDFLFDDDSKFWSMKIPMGPEEKFTGSLAEKAHVDKMKISEIAEHARVLYVAMTRAIDSVFLSWNSKVEKNSWAHMIRWDLSQGPHSRDFYSYEVLDRKPNPRIVVLSSTKSSGVRSLVQLNPNEKEMKLKHSVTSLLEKQPAKEKARPKESEPWLEHFKVISHGSLTHKLMQALKYSQDVDSLVERWFKSKKSEVFQVLEFLKTLESPPLMKLIQEGHVEMGFSYREGTQIIDGQIDLWGIVQNEVWIVDYKTGSIKYREKAFSQLSYYAKALQKSKMISVEQKIQLAVIYPFSEEVFTRSL